MDDGRWRLQHGHAVALTGEAGYFWFFDLNNLEIVVKTLNGCGTNGHYWFFAAGLTDLEVTITVTDRTTGEDPDLPESPGNRLRPDPRHGRVRGLRGGPVARHALPVPVFPGWTRRPAHPSHGRRHVSAHLSFGRCRARHLFNSRCSESPAGAVAPGADYVVTVTPTPAQRGRYNFACTRVCGVGHGGMFGAIEVE